MLRIDEFTVNRSVVPPLATVSSYPSSRGHAASTVGSATPWRSQRCQTCHREPRRRSTWASAPGVWPVGPVDPWVPLAATLSGAEGRAWGAHSNFRSGFKKK
jgi:hypothetical protein